MLWCVVGLLAFPLMGEPVVRPIYLDQGKYVSPTIGLGPDGGSISVLIELLGPAKTLEPQLSLLTTPQLEAWKPALDFFPVEPNALVSTLTKTVGSEPLQFTASLPSSKPEEYVFILSFPGEVPDSDYARAVGRLSVEWEQADGSFLQYQLWKLPHAISVITNLLIAAFAIFAVSLFMNWQLSNLLHYLFAGFMVYALIFLSVWQWSIGTEKETGNRTSWDTKWLPSLLEKGFDIMEVLLYLVTAVGWKTVRSNFYPNEIQFMVTGSALSFLLGLFEILSGDDNVVAGNFTSARMIVHMFGYLAAIVGFNYHLSFGGALLQESSIASRETAKTYFQVNKFWWLRAIFLLFIVQPTIAVVIRTDILGWEDDWLFIAFFWATKIFLLVAVAFVFRPRPVDRMGLVELAIKERRRQARTQDVQT